MYVSIQYMLHFVHLSLNHLVRITCICYDVFIYWVPDLQALYSDIYTGLPRPINRIDVIFQKYGSLSLSPSGVNPTIHEFPFLKKTDYHDILVSLELNLKYSLP